MAQADKSLDATLAVAMAKNHGIDENGKNLNKDEVKLKDCRDQRSGRLCIT